MIDIRNEKILPSVAIKVGRIDAHAGARPAGLAVRDACCQTNLFKLSRSLVEEKKVRHRVVGHKQIEERIVVDVGRNCSKRLARMFCDSRLTTHVLKSAIAFVAKET